MCQAKSGMGKTSVFVLSILQLMTPVDGGYLPLSALVMAPTRELAHQIYLEFKRMSFYFENPKIVLGCFFGGIGLEFHTRDLDSEEYNPHIVIGTPGRLLDLTRRKYLNLTNVLRILNLGSIPCPRLMRYDFAEFQHAIRFHKNVRTHASQQTSPHAECHFLLVYQKGRFELHERSGGGFCWFWGTEFGWLEAVLHRTWWGNSLHIVEQKTEKTHPPAWHFAI